MNSSAAVFFCLFKNRLSAWLIKPGHSARGLPVHGEDEVRIQRSEALHEAVNDVIARLEGEGASFQIMHWLIDRPGYAHWAQLVSRMPQLPEPGGHLQVLSWEWLTARLGLASDSDALDKHTLTKVILPWLLSADDAAERQQMQDALAREHDSESARLAAERLQLQQDNQRLRDMNAALQQADAENLLRFLPALYPRIFTVLGATDLALLCGRVEPLAIANPYPEPSEETLRVLQKDFRNLPIALQQQIVDFVKRLPQRQKLSPRSEMRELVSDLERR